MAWDSAFWGFPIAQLNASRLAHESLRRALDWAAREKTRCLYFAADGSDGETLRLASEGGFRFVDLRVEMEKHLLGSIQGKSPALGIRISRAADLATLKDIARYSHEDTRFFKDISFDRARAAELYAKWIERDASEHVILVFTMPDKAKSVVGYVTCRVEAPGKGRIGLIAVAREVRGKGLGGELVKAALSWFADKSIRTVCGATQACNVPAMRLYESAGFRARETKVWFHWWSTI
jgi:dTDP-4-amino-4,6-dideoxy-D-galactose acyltransferase